MNTGTTQTISILGEQLELLPDKVIYWRSKRMLILADLHMGKAGHFQKNGIPVPDSVNQTNLQKLERVFSQYDVAECLILGDLFHNELNYEWQLFADWLEGINGDIRFALVRGNHDRLPAFIYEKADLKTVPEFICDPFVMIHDPEERSAAAYKGYYALTAHVHPSVIVRGKGLQRLRLPCFYFSHDHAILPAFGSFTGTHAIQPKENDSVFVIADETVTKV